MLQAGNDAHQIELFGGFFGLTGALVEFAQRDEKFGQWHLVGDGGVDADGVVELSAGGVDACQPGAGVDVVGLGGQGGLIVRFSGCPIAAVEVEVS